MRFLFLRLSVEYSTRAEFPGGESDFTGENGEGKGSGEIVCMLKLRIYLFLRSANILYSCTEIDVFVDETIFYRIWHRRSINCLVVDPAI